MTFRYARHSKNLEYIEDFYTKIVGLKVLGKFKDHDDYNGLFLGFPHKDWHLEFTSSSNQPNQVFDEDDALVFYVDSIEKLTHKQKHLINANIPLELPKNPYWQENGIMISDPDGFKIIFSVKKN